MPRKNGERIISPVSGLRSGPHSGTSVIAISANTPAAARPAASSPFFSSEVNGCIERPSRISSSASEASYLPSLGSTMKIVTSEPTMVIMNVETNMKK